MERERERERDHKITVTEWSRVHPEFQKAKHTDFYIKCPFGGA